jgi:hypothetical protein
MSPPLPPLVTVDAIPGPLAPAPPSLARLPRRRLSPSLNTRTAAHQHLPASVVQATEHPLSLQYCNRKMVNILGYQLLILFIGIDSYVV